MEQLSTEEKPVFRFENEVRPDNALWMEAVAQKYLELAYSENIAKSFLLYPKRIYKRKRKGYRVHCFNGGAFAQVQFPIEGEIHSTGDYRKHRRVAIKQLMKFAESLAISNPSI